MHVMKPTSSRRCRSNGVDSCSTGDTTVAVAKGLNPPGSSLRGGGREILTDFHVDEADDLLAEQLLQPGANQGGGPLDLALPGGIFGAHMQHVVAQLHAGGLVDGAPDRRTPGKCDFFRGERRLAENRGERARHQQVRGGHSVRRYQSYLLCRAFDAQIVSM